MTLAKEIQARQLPPQINGSGDAETIGLLAGWGQFPITFSRNAKAQGFRVVCVGIKGSAESSLIQEVDEFAWAGVAQIGRMIRKFKGSGVKRLVMAGKIFKANYLYAPWKVISLIPDWRMVKFWYSRTTHDNRDDTLLLGVIREFNKDGLDFFPALDFCPELLVKTGILTHRKTTAAEDKDIAFGWGLAKEMGRLDVGQSIAVKDHCVLAVEALEGTDEAIIRAGALCRKGGFILVKVAKPNQDMRFDVPTVGIKTIQNLHRSGGRVLAIEGGKTIFLDGPETISLANRLGIAIVALDNGGARFADNNYPITTPWKKWPELLSHKI